MASLFSVQRAVRDAIVAGDSAGVDALLRGGTGPASRMHIHQRHYRASLMATLRGRFPATAWLIGDVAMTNAAAAFVIDHPPRVFCMAEYGDAFPAYLASRPGLTMLPYLESFGLLEWEVGRVSVAVSAPALTLDWLQEQAVESLGSMGLTLQPGVSYLTSHAAVDELFLAFLSGDVPEHFALQPGPRWIEVRGSRGVMDVRPLPVAAWHFRRALLGGASIEGAAGVALDADPAFDPGGALVHLIADGLAVAPRSSPVSH